MKPWIRKLKVEDRRLAELTGRIRQVYRELAYHTDFGARWYLFMELLLRLDKTQGLAERLQECKAWRGRVPGVQQAIEALAEVSPRADVWAQVSENSHGFEWAPEPSDSADDAFLALAELWDQEILLRWLQKIQPPDRVAAFEAPPQDLAPPTPVPDLKEWQQVLSTPVSERVREMTRNYRRAWLLLSILGEVPECFSQLEDEAEEAAMKDATTHADELLARLDADRDVTATAIFVVRQIASVVSEGGYETLLDILHGNGAGSGAVPGIGDSMVNLIPAEDTSGTCRPIVVTTIRGQRGRYGYTRVLKELTTHLIECIRHTRVVIVVTDTWDSASFCSDHLPNWKGFADHGIAFLAFLAGPSVRAINPIDIALPTRRRAGVAKIS